MRFFSSTRLRVLLKNRNVPLYVVYHDYTWHQLAKAVSVAGVSVVNRADSLQNEVMRNWYVGTVGGVNIFTTSNLTVDANDDVTSGMFVPQAIGLDMRRAPRIRPERDESRRGLELNMSGVYAHGVIRPTLGIKLVFDASAPSS